MARFGVLIFTLAMVFSSANGWAYDKNGMFTAYDHRSCGYYLEGCSRATLENDRSMGGPHEAWVVAGWIMGYLTAYNRFNDNGKESILGSMTGNDTLGAVSLMRTSLQST